MGFQKKSGLDDSVEKHKAQLVTKRYSLVEGINYAEISLFTKATSIWFLLSLDTVHDREIKKMDVKTTFFHGDLEEEIYLSHPMHFIVKGKENLVCKLKKSWYGFK